MTRWASNCARGPGEGPCARYEVRFSSLFQEGRGLALPCDAGGRVEVPCWGPGMNEEVNLKVSMTDGPHGAARYQALA